MATDQPAETPRQRLARLMNTRRADLGMTWKEVADKGELTTETLRQVRYGDSDIRELTKRGIERALKWIPGSVDRVMRGERPVDDAWKAIDALVATMCVEGPVELSFMRAILDAGLPATEQVNLMRWVVRRRTEQHAALMAELEVMLRARRAELPKEDDLPYSHLPN